MISDKVLNLRFYYKGKNLDTAKEERDIENKFIVGSDKNIQWQILDKSFPKRHLLIKKAKDSFRLVLNKRMQVTVKKGDQLLTEEALRDRKLLKNNELIMDMDSTGYVTCARYWCIAYEFVTPEKRVLTNEEKKLIQQYYRRPPLSSQQKLSRNLLIIALLLTIIGAFFFERYYTPPMYERSLSQRVQIDPVTIPEEEQLVFEEYITDEPDEVPEGVEGLTGAAGILGFNPQDVSGPMVDLQGGRTTLTYSEQIIAGEGGAGSGEGPGGAGTATPGRAGTSFDAGAIVQRSGPPGDLFSGDIDAARRMGLRDIDPDAIRGSSEGIAYSHISTEEQLASLARARQRALSSGIEIVDESEIESAEPADRNAAMNIRQYIEPNFGQLHDLFAQESQLRNIYGSIQITLHFREDGRVEAVNLEERAGSFFTESFKIRAIEIMRQWRVPTTRQLPAYSFQIRFVRS